ncbi:hypothetical protein AXF42_Ash015388 [Apostasia shenzhenica]|uniref:RING-CH-type domain-containing protein n=1 Tax=Apostasia shenzhenica TaxID=1088818 RepID=A0A2H9ZS28_9ASPA|nr:hypothetical protein AXF42_Ash015388 [Apostasia shenzhenica]
MGSVDLENGVSEVEATPDKSERDCRICHLSLEIQTQESGVPFVLGCSCKDDLAAAHKKCAETWFKIKGNKSNACNEAESSGVCSTSEICGSAVENVAVAVQAGSTETETADGNRNDAVEASTTDGRRRHFWQGGHRFINALLACVVIKKDKNDKI